jgi:hypothetical protein
VMPLDYYIYLPIIRNGVDSVEVPWASQGYSDDIATYDICTPKVTINMNSKYFENNPASFIYSIQIKGISFTNVNKFSTGWDNTLPNVLTSYLIGSSLRMTTSTLVNKFNGWTMLNTYFYSTNTLHRFKAIYSCAINANLSSSNRFITNSRKDDLSIDGNVFRNTNASNNNNLIGDAGSSSTLYISGKNKFINFKSAYQYTNGEIEVSSPTLYFETVPFFAKPLISGNKGLKIVTSRTVANTGVTFGNEPTTARLSFNGTTAATEYYNDNVGLNALLIAPDKYRTRNTYNDCYNATGSTITSKTVVKLTGTLTTGTPNVTEVTAVTDVPYGILEEDLTTATQGRVVEIGKIATVNDYSTSSLNAPLYFTSAGVLSLTDTNSPVIARVITTTGTTDSIYVDFTGISSYKNKDSQRTLTAAGTITAADNVVVFDGTADIAQSLPAASGFTRSITFINIDPAFKVTFTPNGADTMDETILLAGERMTFLVVGTNWCLV